MMQRIRRDSGVSIAGAVRRLVREMLARMGRFHRFAAGLSRFGGQSPAVVQFTFRAMPMVGSIAFGAAGLLPEFVGAEGDFFVAGGVGGRHAGFQTSSGGQSACAPGRCPGQTSARVPLPEAGRFSPRRPAGLGSREVTLDGLVEVKQREGPGHDFHGASREHLLLDIVPRPPRDHDYRNSPEPRFLPKVLQESHAIEPWHLEIQQNEIDRRLLQNLDCGQSVGRRHDLVTHARDRCPQHAEDRRIVINDQDPAWPRPRRDIRQEDGRWAGGGGHRPIDTRIRSQCSAWPQQPCKMHEANPFPSQPAQRQPSPGATVARMASMTCTL